METDIKSEVPRSYLVSFVESSKVLKMNSKFLDVFVLSPFLYLKAFICYQRELSFASVATVQKTKVSSLSMENCIVD